MSNYTRLCMKERCQLALFLDMGLKISEIAGRMDRHRSTLYRELSRNHTRGHYRPGLAHRQARRRHPRKCLKLQSDKALYHYVYDRLTQGWSPEQIAGRMKREKKTNPICHETIYRYIYQQANNLIQYLPFQKRKRKRYPAKKKMLCRFGNIRLIDKRPASIEKRDIFGHWEGDLIEFNGTKSKTVTTLVERKSRLVSLLKNTNKQSGAIMAKIANQFTSQPYLRCRTITFDQGNEFADYEHLEQQVSCHVYYCQTHSPWQKGSNENMNRRLRRYLPRHTQIEKVSQEYLDQLAERMNNLPRKCLAFNTPKELFLKYRYDARRAES